MYHSAQNGVFPFIIVLFVHRLFLYTTLQLSTISFYQDSLYCSLLQSCISNRNQDTISRQKMPRSTACEWTQLVFKLSKLESLEQGQNTVTKNLKSKQECINVSIASPKSKSMKIFLISSTHHMLGQLWCTQLWSCL